MKQIDVFTALRSHLQGAGFETTRNEKEHPNMMFLINNEGHILASTVSEIRESKHPLPIFANITLSFPWGRVDGVCKERQTKPEVALKLAITNILSHKNLPKELRLAFESFLAKDVLIFPKKKVA